MVTDAGPPYGTIAFDCDSTLSAIEGVDELCRIEGVDASATEELTARAMAGEIALEEVYSRRLEALRPGSAELRALGERYVAARLPHAEHLVRALSALEKRVCIVSGGLLQPVLELARCLGIDRENVFAVEAFLDRGGAYAGYDELSPLVRSGGKLDVLRQIARADRGGGVAFVGDGATDLEAAPAARRFVAFGGVERRAIVFASAAVTCESRDLAHLLPLLASRDEIDRLAGLGGHEILLGAMGRS
jgi:phosphoserine phosphatase